MDGSGACLLVAIGTRPEAIKLAPLVERLAARGAAVMTCATGQHCRLLADAAESLGLSFDLSLPPLTTGCDPEAQAGAIERAVAAVIARSRLDWLIVQGDTSSALGAARAAHAGGVAVAHVEAGLRTGDLAAPWPEEGNRRAIARLATFHFAPTQRAANNLLREGVAADAIEVVGNTGIDALQAMLARLRSDHALADRALAECALPASGRRLILITGHRRENLGAGLDGVAEAARRLAARGDVDIVVPVHPNPGATAFAESLRGTARVHLRPALSYEACVAVLRRATLVITDSGGLQEEAPALGVPVLVTRRSTERQEGVDAGAALVVDTNADTIAGLAAALLDDAAAYRAMARIRHPFGDGRAAERIAARLLRLPAKLEPQRL